MAEEVKAPEKEEPAKQVEYAGRFFDTEVPRDNYEFVKAGLVLFGNKFGPPPQSQEEEEDCVWEQLLLSYEAHRRGVTVAQEEIDSEVRKLLAAQKADFDWEKNKEAYQQWVLEKTNASSLLFENLIRHNLQLQKLRQQVMDSLKVSVRRKEAVQEYLNEYNTLKLELAEFARGKEAWDFYAKARAGQKFWEEEKGKRPKEFRSPGFVSLEFLIDIWRFPKDDLYRMMKMRIGAVYPPVPIYKGYGVCKILEIRAAQIKDFGPLRESYYDQLRQRKEYEGLGQWFEGLKKQAKIVRYKKTP